MTPSCTSALELACGAVGLKAGDEVVVPSFTFPSVPNAVILRGAVPVFADVREDTLCLDAARVFEALTPKTRALIVIHYAGVSADMGALLSVAKAHGLYVIEDAAQAIGSWQLKGDLGALSFHDTKNIGCGEGGALLVRNLDLLERVETLRDCGVSRNPRTGERYRWDAAGQSALMGEPCAEVLWSRLQDLPEITNARRAAWQVYQQEILVRDRSRRLGNGHIFWFLSRERDALVAELRRRGVHACSHYEAAHLCAPGRAYGRRGGELGVSERVASQIVRLPTDVSVTRAHEIASIVNDVLSRGDYEQEKRRIRRVETGGGEQRASAL